MADRAGWGGCPGGKDGGVVPTIDLGRSSAAPNGIDHVCDGAIIEVGGLGIGGPAVTS